MRWSAPRWPRFVTSTLHKNISLLSVVFLATHIATTLFDPVSPVHLVNAIVPFTGSYRPLGIGLGVVAVDLLAALVITSLLQAADRLPDLARGALERVRVLAGRDVARTELRHRRRGAVGARRLRRRARRSSFAGIGWRVTAAIAENSKADSTRRVVYPGVAR